MTDPYIVGLMSGALAGITLSMILLALVFKPYDTWEQPNE